MSNYASGVNPAILKWAREKAGYSIEAVAQSLKQDVAQVECWESGEGLPTYGQLEKLAYTLYKRPVALFFFPQPPNEPDLDQSFRTLPHAEIEKLLPDTRKALREAQAMQIVLRELNDGVNPCQRKIFRDLDVDVRSDITLSARIIRAYLGVPLDAQVAWHNWEQALSTWRNVIQDVGVFVFKRSFKQEDISGFCIFDDEFPLIFLNNSTAKTRQIFTIFHELAHLLLKTNGITKDDDRYIDSLQGDAKEVEVYCNSFAGEYLVPSEDFDKKLIYNQSVESFVGKACEYYRVSREVILRKLLDRGMVNSDYYESKVLEWVDEYRKSRRAKSGGGDYYATQVSYLGEKFLSLAFSKYYEGKFSMEQLADYFNVKATSVSGLEHQLLRKAASDVRA